MRNLVSVLVQSEKFGTSIAKTLRVHSDTLRTQRRQKVEEQAAKTTSSWSSRSCLFIFPSLFLVTLGPALHRDHRSLSKRISLTKEGRAIAMDNVTLIRVVAGVLFCVVLFILVQRRRSRVH